MSKMFSLIRGIPIYKEIKTNRIGEADQSLKNDMYYIVVSAKDYGAAEQAVEVHQDSLKEITFYLGEPSEEPLIVQEIDTVVDPEIIPAPEDTISTKELPIDLYAPNNVVFLIDVSVSMKQEQEFVFRIMFGLSANIYLERQTLFMVANQVFSSVLLNKV